MYTIEKNINNINKELKKAYKEKNINSIRQVLEAICELIILKEYGEEEGTKIIRDKPDAVIRGYTVNTAIEQIIFHENKTKKLVDNNIMKNYFEYIQGQSNIGSHKDFVKLDNEAVLLLFIHLNKVIEWLYIEYLSMEIDPEINDYIKIEYSNFESDTLKVYDLDSNWNDLLSSTSNFNDKLNKYFLITESIENIGFIESLFNINWTYIADFDDESFDSGLYNASKDLFKEKRNVNLLIQGNKLDYSKSTTYWDFVRGTKSTPTTLCSKFIHWNKKYIISGELQKHIKTLEEEIEPSNYFMFIFWNGKLTRNHLITYLSIWDLLFPSLNVIVCSEKNTILEELRLELEDFDFENIQYFNLPFNKFSTLLFNFNKSKNKETVNIPSSVGGEIVFCTVENSEYIKYIDDVKIFPIENKDDPKDCNDYYKGNSIDFAYLEQECIIKRNKYLELLSEIKKLAESRTNKTYYILSEAGAGSTSLAYSLLWDSRSKFPSLHLMNYRKKNTYLFLQYLYTVTKTPLIIFTDNNIGDENIKLLRTELENQQIKFIIIRVIRFISKQDLDEYKHSHKHNHYILTDSLTSEESKKVYNKLISLNIDRKEELLKIKNNIKPSLFKYLFSTFLDDYKNIDKYIKDKIRELNDYQKKRLLYISLIQYFTGLEVSIAFITNKNIDLNFLSNSSVKGLIHHTEDGKIRIIHNIVARKFLTFLSGLNDEKLLHQKIKYLSIGFLNFIDENMNLKKDNKTILEIINSLFIRRKNNIYDTESNGSNKYYTDLLDKTTADDREEIFSRLVELYPKNSHFLGHFGRFYSIDRKNMKKALEFIDRAIECSEEVAESNHHDSILYHIKGTIFSREVSVKKDMGSLTLIELIDLAKQAISYFDLSLEYDSQSNNDYPYISKAKLIINILRKGKDDYGSLNSFINENFEDPFIQSLPDKLEEIISEFQDISRDENINSFDIENIESQLHDLYGDYSSAISTLYNKLATSNYNNHIIRRSIIRLTIKKAGNDINKIDEQKINTFISFLEHNLRNLEGCDLSISDLTLFLMLIRHKKVKYNLLDIADILRDLKDYFDGIEIERNKKYKNFRLQVLFYYCLVKFIQLINGNNDVFDEINELREEISTNSMYIRGGKTFDREWLSSFDSNFKSYIHRYDPKINWNDDLKFFDERSLDHLVKCKGKIKKINGQNRGYIEFLGLDIFFVPRAKFTTNDLNKEVEFFLSFSYDEMRAWNVEYV